MSNRLAGAISPYLRSHAENPVDWFPWGEEAFATARARNVPVLVSIGYSTCHWCHVMARESFSDPVLAGELNARFVAIKVDREEHPEVDAAYLAAAGAFTPDLGWPLNVFVTPEGWPFYAGTYSPPVPAPGHPSFGQVLAAVTEAWTERHGEVLDSAAQLTAALAAAAAAAASTSASTSAGPGTATDAAAAAAPGAPAAPALPEESRFAEPVAELAGYEDERFGGFGGAPKFPVAPVLLFLLAHDGETARPLAERTLAAMAASPLRDPVEGGFFRYATARDWSDPHYERMLYDNALLLDAYTTVAARDPEAAWALRAADGIAAFLLGVLQLPSGGFASAQDSESVVDGARTEGGYYRLSAADRARQVPPALDRKILAGWNGLALGALARAGFVAGRPEWIAAAERAAEHLLAVHRRPDGSLVRVSIDGRLSTAAATLEDHGMLAGGLVRLAAVTGSVRWAVAGRELVDAVLAAGFRAPGGGDPVLHEQGLAVALDPSEGAYPSGLSAVADACLSLYALTADQTYQAAAQGALAPLAETALQRPIAFGATLELLLRLARPLEQLVLVEPDGGAGGPGGGGSGDAAALAAERAAEGLREAVRRWPRGFVARSDDAGARMLAAAGFELFADRASRSGHPAAYRCCDFVCRLPAGTAEQLRAAGPGAAIDGGPGTSATEG